MDLALLNLLLHLSSLLQHPLPFRKVVSYSVTPSLTSHKTQNHLSFLLCTTPTCHATFHLPCLANTFTSPSPSPTTAPIPTTTTRPLLPTLGTCPACETQVHWQDLIRGSVRRHEEITGVRKGGKVKRKKKKSLSAPESSDEELAFGDESDEERSWAVEGAREGAFEEGEESVEEGGRYPLTQVSPKKRKEPPREKEPVEKVATMRQKKAVTPVPVVKGAQERAREVVARARKQEVMYIDLSD